MIRLAFKRNDQQSAPGKENLGQRNGMLTSFYREGGYWPTLGKRFKSAYFCVDVDDTPENLATARAMCEPVEVWLPDGKVDGEKSRARSGRVSFKALEPVLLSPGLDTIVQSTVELEPVKAPGLRLSTIVLNTTDLPDARLDVRAVTAGSYTIGSAAQDYPDRATAYGDLGSPFTGHLTFTAETTIVDSAGAAITETLDGYTFTDTCDTPPAGDPTGGLIWSIDHNAHGVTLQQEGNGTVDICAVYGKRTTAGSVNNRSFYRVINVGAPPVLQTVKIRECLYDGNNLKGTGIAVVDGSLVVEVKNNKIWNCTREGIALLAGQGNAASVYENNVVRGCLVGLAADGEDGTFNNNGFYNNTTDVTNIGGGTGNSNSDTDGTAANGNWLAGAGNRTGTAAADFRSTNQAQSTFLDLKYGGGLVGVGTLAILADNTAGAGGRPRPNTEGTVSIGANEAIYPVITPPLVPASGNVAGGDSVVIDGTSFEDSGASVTFGGTPVTSVDAQSNTQITVTNPAHAAGLVDVIVTNDWGASYIGVGLFTYIGVVPPTFDEAAVATVRRPLGLVTVHWGGSLLDNLEVTWPNTVGNWLMDEVPQLPPQIADGVDVVVHKWFRCDGVAQLDEMVLAPGDAEGAALYQMGWWGGTFAGPGGAFADPQYVRIKMVEQLVSTVAVVGDAALGEYPVDFTIKVFSGPSGSILEDETVVVGNALVTREIAVGPVFEASAILLTITKWSDADAVIKICELYTSTVETYDGDEIMSISVLEENETKDATLPTGNITANELELSLNNVDDKFFPANDLAPLHAMVRKNRKIVVQLGFDIPGVGAEYVAMGTYWSGDWKVSENGTTASTTALDRLGRLRKMTYWSSEVYFDYTIGQLIDVVMVAARLQMVDLVYEVEAALYGAEYTVPVAWFPKDSFFEAIKTLSGASLGRVYADRDDVIQFLGPAEVGAFEYELTADDYYDRTQPEEWESVENRIEVTTQPLRLDPDEGEQVEVYRSSEDLEMLIGQAQEFTIEYSDKPVDLVTIVAEAADGSPFVGTVTSSEYAWGADIVVTCSAAGAFRIVATGNVYTIDGKQIVVRIDEDSQFQYGEQRYSLKENALIQTEKLAAQIAGTLLETYKDPARDIELNWRGNPNHKLDTVIRAPEYVRGAVSNKSDFLTYKQKTKFDGTLRMSTSGRRVREVTDLSMQDTDGTLNDMQDTDDSGNLSLQD